MPCPDRKHRNVVMFGGPTRPGRRLFYFPLPENYFAKTVRAGLCTSIE